MLSNKSWLQHKPGGCSGRSWFRFTDRWDFGASRSSRGTDTIIPWDCSLAPEPEQESPQVTMNHQSHQLQTGFPAPRLIPTHLVFLQPPTWRTGQKGTDQLCTEFNFNEVFKHKGRGYITSIINHHGFLISFKTAKSLEQEVLHLAETIQVVCHQQEH